MTWRRAEGDLDGFAVWVEPYVAALTAVAERLAGPNDAADLVQETLLRAWRRWHTFDRGRGSPRAWLTAIMYDRARRSRVRSRPDYVLGVPEPQIAAQFEPGEVDRLDLESAIASLPSRQKHVVTLYYLADLGVDEVASILDISSGAVKAHLSAARRSLRAIVTTDSREVP